MSDKRRKETKDDVLPVDDRTVDYDELTMRGTIVPNTVQTLQVVGTNTSYGNLAFSTGYSDSRSAVSYSQGSSMLIDPYQMKTVVVQATETSNTRIASNLKFASVDQGKVNTTLSAMGFST